MIVDIVVAVVAAVRTTHVLKKMYSEKQWNFFSHSECSHRHPFIQRLRNTQPDAYQNLLKIFVISMIHILFKLQNYLSQQFFTYIRRCTY